MRAPSRVLTSPEEAPLPPRRSTRKRKVPTRYGNVYGETKTPHRIERDIERARDWEQHLESEGELTSHPRDVEEGPSRLRQPPGHFETEESSDEESVQPQLPHLTRPRSRATTRHSSPGTHHPASSSSGESGSSEEETSSENTDNVQTAPGPNPTTPAHHSDDQVEDILTTLTQEGGVRFLNYLLAKAVSPDSESLDVSKVKEWSYRDILRMNIAQQKEWKAACQQELNSLRARDVYDLVNPPSGRKIIKNRWVFDVKTDGRKKARLVAKGFSQVEGIDFEDIFLPVVRYETVWLILALCST